jgi:hypothetical protein
MASGRTKRYSALEVQLPYRLSAGTQRDILLQLQPIQCLFISQIEAPKSPGTRGLCRIAVSKQWFTTWEQLGNSIDEYRARPCCMT